MSHRIKVAIKVRPLIEREELEGLFIQWEVKNNSIFQKDGGGKCYSFDHVFDITTKNYDVFNRIARPIIDSSVAGFNGTIFAYGQTSSGKTHTMIGSQDDPGIIPMTIHYIFEALNGVQGREFLLRASYIEIYNEKVNDLLEEGKTGLKLREVEGGVLICGLKEEVVHTPDKIMQLMERGKNIRHTGETNMNKISSRSHTIFRIIIESRVPSEGEDGVVQVSHLNMVDLAGSERVDQTGSKGDRLKEGCSINRSLFMLSHVISQLSEGQDQYVNFRDSKLTRILRSSLGGNAHTAIICAVTPASVVETASTLGFASRALHVKNKPHVNEVLSDTALLKRYARQIIKLQAELEKTKNRNRTDEVEEVESKLQEQQRHNEFLQRRIDLLKEKLIGSAATDSVEMNRRRAFRRRTWCGHTSRKSSLQIIPALETIDEGATYLSPFLEQDCISSSIQELAENTFFETPLEEFELQLMDTEERLSQDSMESPEQQPYNITVRRSKSRHVTFADHVKSPESQIKQPVDICSQTDALLINFHLTNSLESNFHETPPQILRERIRYYQNEYDELRKFTVLEKQMYNAGCDKELTQLEMENRQLQKSVNDLKTMILDVNCINSKLQVENKSLKERLMKESEKCNALISHLQPLDDVERELSQRTEETVALKKQLHFATQRMKELENEKNDLGMARELAEANLKRRNGELTCSLEDAWMNLKDKNNQIAVLKQNTEDLKQMTEEIEEVMKTGPNTQKLRRIQEELKSVTENNLMCIDQMNATNECLGLLEQENHEMLRKHIEDMDFVKVANLKYIDELKEKSIMVEEEMNLLKQQNSMYIKQAKEKDECLETLEQQTGDLNSASEPNWNGLDEMEGNSVRIQEQINSLREENSMFMKQLKEKDSYIETLNRQIIGLNCAKEANLKYLDVLKMNSITVQEEIDCLKEANSMYIEQLKEKDNCLEKLNEQIKELNCAKDANLEYIDVLKTSNISVQEEINSLKESNFMYVEQLKEKDGYIETLNRQIKDLNCAREANLKYLDELKMSNISVQEEIDCLKEEKSMYIEQLKEKDNCLEKLNEQIKELNCAKEANLKCIDELKTSNISVQEEINSLKESNFMYVEQLKEKDNCLETLNQEIKDLNCAKEANLKYIDELKTSNISVQEEINSLKESNFMYVEQLKEKDYCLDVGTAHTLNQEIKDLNCAKEANLKYLDELKMSNISVQEEIDCLKEENSMYIEQLKEKDNFLEKLNEQIKELNCAKEANLKYIDELKMSNISVQEELNSLKESNFMYVEQLKEKDYCLETLNQEIKDLNCAKEANLKCLDELKMSNISVQEEIDCLKEENSVYIEQLKEKDNCLEKLNEQIKELNCAKEANLKCLDELKMSNISVQEEIDCLKGKNFMYVEQLKEKNNFLETLNQQIKDLICEKQDNFKYIDILKNNSLSVQEEINSLKEENFMYVEQLKEKDNCLEKLNQQIKDLSSGKEDSLKDIDLLKSNSTSVQKDMNSLKEENSIYINHLKERDDYFQTLHEQIKGLNCAKEANLKYIDELKMSNIDKQEEIDCLKEKNFMYIEQLKEKDNCLEKLNKQIKELNCAKEANLKYLDELKMSYIGVQEEINSLKESNFMYAEELKAKDNSLETLKKQIKDLISDKQDNLKYIDVLRNSLISKQEEMSSLKEENFMYVEQQKEKDNCLEKLNEQIKDLNCAKEANLKCLDELKMSNISVQEEIDCLKEEYFMYIDQLKDKDNCLEKLNEQIKELNCAKDANLKYIDELKTSNISVQEEINSLKESNCMYVEQLKQKYNCLEILNQQIKDLICAKETNLKYLDTLKTNNITVQEQIDCLKEENFMYIEQLKEKDNCLEKLNQQITDLISEKQDSLKDIDVLKNNSTSVQKEINSLKEANSMYIEQLKERDNYLETLNQQIRDLNLAKDANLKYIDELKLNSISLQEEINFLKEQNSLYTEHLNERDNHHETPKQPTKDVNSVKATSLKYTDELKANDIRLQKEINFQTEENSLYWAQLYEKDNGLEAMNQQINDVNAVKETNLMYTEQLQKMDKCPESLRHEYSEQSQLYEVLAKQMTHYNQELSDELSEWIKRSLSEKSYEIESCRQMMLKEVRDLKPNYDVESLRKCQLTELLKILLRFVMEKEAEMFHMLQKQMNEMHTQASESEKEYDDKGRRKDCWVRELEAEVTKSEVVTEPAENLVLKKQLEVGLEKQRELAKENENLAIHITGLREEVNKLVTEITNLTKSINILVAEKHGINVPVCIEDCEMEDLKRQQDRCLHEKTTLVANCKCMQEQQDVICSEHEHRSPVIKKESCLESLHSESQLLSVGVADSMTQNCQIEVSEEENLKEQLEICMEQKIALDDENEQLVTRIRGLENMLEIYCVDNDSLQKSNEALEEHKKKLVLELSVSHKNLLDAESEIQELKLKTIAVRKTEDLEAEVENLQIRNKLLLQESQSASNNISELCALNNQLRAQLTGRTDVQKASVATITTISGPCHCKELTEKVHELKLINVQRNNRIGILELQIKAEEFPYQQRAKELEDSVSYYKNKNMELRTDLRRLHHMIKENDSSENCDSCRKRKSLKSYHVAIQTDEVEDENFLMAGGGGSGIIREDQLMKMRIKIYELESKNETLKELCRERRRRILGLEEKLMAECRPCNIEEERGSDSREFQGVEKQSNGAGPSSDVEPIQSKGFSSGQVRVQAGNKENSLNIRETLQRPRQNMYNIGYTRNTRRPLKENAERDIDDLGGFSKN